MMGDVVEKAWARKTRKSDYMDAIQISVSILLIIAKTKKSNNWMKFDEILDGVLW